MTYRDDPKIAAKYKSKQWSKLRKVYLLQVDGLCERCRAKGIYNTAIIVHHKEYITNKNYIDDSIFYNPANLEALCRDCHNKEHFAEKENEEFYFDEEGNLIKR